MSSRARIHYGAGVIVLAPVPAGFPFADLVSGPCRACNGTARREFPMPASHRRRIDRIPSRACHDCAGEGVAMADRGSVIGRMVATANRHDS